MNWRGNVNQNLINYLFYLKCSRSFVRQNKTIYTHTEELFLNENFAKTFAY